MSEMGNELVKAARHELGRPFRHHHKPNVCEGGHITLDSCMENGMDPRGYDCTGLVVASLCSVLGIEASRWPRDYRHSNQLHGFADDVDPDFGDILLIESQSDSGYQYMTHAAVQLGPDQVLHANGRTKVVDESEVMGIVTGIRRINTDDFARMAFGKITKDLRTVD